jgi:hypothetical protein
VRLLLELAQDFLMFRKAAGFMLRVDLPTVENHVKNATPTFNEFDLATCLCFDRFRQTGGFGLIVSLYAIGDGNRHD